MTERADVPGGRGRRLVELARLFLKLGFTAFGGPAAHIAMMENEVVRCRGWLGREEFLDLLGATNLIPGPNSTEMAIHIGRRRAGWVGLVVAGACFIVPAMTITLVVAWAYVRFGALPQTAGVLYGVKPVIIAVVVQALWRLGRSAVRSTLLAFAALLATAASLLGANELLVLGAAGIGVGVVRWFGSGSRGPSASQGETGGRGARREAAGRAGAQRRAGAQLPAGSPRRAGSQLPAESRRAGSRLPAESRRRAGSLPRERLRSASCRSSWSSSKWGPFSSGAATCCSPFFGPISSRGCTG